MSFSGYPLPFYGRGYGGSYSPSLSDNSGSGGGNRLIYDKTQTVGVPNNGGPSAIPIHLPSTADSLMVEAWISNFGASNVHLLNGRFSLSDAQALLTNLPGAINQILMTLTYAGPTVINIDSDPPSDITVFFEAVNSSGQAELITIRTVGFGE